MLLGRVRCDPAPGPAPVPRSAPRIRERVPRRAAVSEIDRVGSGLKYPLMRVLQHALRRVLVTEAQGFAAMSFHVVPRSHGGAHRGVRHARR